MKLLQSFILETFNKSITIMKKLFLFALMAIAAISFNSCSKDDGETWTDDSSIIQFTDPLFLKAILSDSENNAFQYKVDKNGDGQISEKEARSIKELEIYEEVRNMDEIRYFTELTAFSWSSDQLEHLDISNNTKLTFLAGGGAKLSSYNIDKNTALTDFRCVGSAITSLNVSNNTALKILYCDNTKLKSLDVSKNTDLEELDCSECQLKSLNISKNVALTSVHCDKNQLTAINLNNPNLKYLFCDDNQLTSLDLSKCPKLEYIDCKNNPNLKSIIISKYHIIKQESVDKIINEYGDIITYVE